MRIHHRDYLTYDLPEKWCAEEMDDSIVIYDPRGKGAMTVSFFSVTEEKQMLENRVCVMAKSFLEQNRIKTDGSLIVSRSDSGKITLYGTGVTPENGFVKLWITAQYPRVVLATYNSRKKSREVKKFDTLVDSMEFQV